MSFKLIKHCLKLELTNRLLLFIVMVEPFKDFFKVVQGSWQVVIIDIYGLLCVQGFDLIHNLFFALAGFNHGVVFKDSFKSLSTIFFVLGYRSLSSAGLIKDVHTFVHGEVGIVVRLLADWVKVVK